MPAYIVFTRERIRDQQLYDTYASKARATLAGHDVKRLVGYGNFESLEGAPVAGVVILEFPTMEAAKAWYDGPEYSAIRGDRFKGADYRVFIAEG
ncbi:MAG TPA: DUF1330 domain-containing protein [Bryobacteraceae bacterium]|nr:DUF1330 domain-containing protein [Bryobacteraceae bacterium]